MGHLKIYGSLVPPHANRCRAHALATSKARAEGRWAEGRWGAVAVCEAEGGRDDSSSEAVEETAAADAVAAEATCESAPLV